jgi:uncharacterized protein
VLASSESRRADNVFIVPVLDQYLVYAPLHSLAALVDSLAVCRIRDSLLAPGEPGAGPLQDLVGLFRSQSRPAPQPKSGAFSPAFLGLIPTRGCNLGCKYCGFLAAEEPDEVMDLELARDAIDWYLGLVSKAGIRTAEIHFFGGEPFCAEEVLDFTFHFARLKASETGCSVRFEVATNGAFDDARCRWAADSLDSIILSLDGPADIQNLHRPRRDGGASFGRVARSATLLSEGAAELSFRVCVTADTAEELPAIARWLCQEFRPLSVGFEPLQPSAPSRAAGLQPPDPWTFAQKFCEAAWLLEAHGVEPVYAAADIRARRVTFCPVGQDVPIVSPDGTIAACYLLERDWEEKGLDLRLGRLEQGSVSLDKDAVAAARSMNVWAEPCCSDCFCKWHCAGGCHVNHVLPDRPGSFDRLCIQTRILALRNILKEMERDDLMVDLLKDGRALERAVWQASDAIASVEIGV